MADKQLDFSNSGLENGGDLFNNGDQVDFDVELNLDINAYGVGCGKKVVESAS